MPESSACQTCSKPWSALPAGGRWRGKYRAAGACPPFAVLAARGARTGPRLLITGGVHGDEYEGPAAIFRIMETLDTSQLCGTVVGLPVLNERAWQARARISPDDRQDLNRLFPGDPSGGSPSERLAEVVFEEFVGACDVLIDLHSGGASLVHLPMAGWYATGAVEAEQAARAFGPLFRPWIIPAGRGVLTYEAARIGKIAVGAEWMGGARMDISGVFAYVSALTRAMRFLNMLPSPMAEQAIETNRAVPISGNYQSAEAGGLFQPCVKLGDVVEHLQPLGCLLNELGEQVQVVRAEKTGVVAALPGIAWRNPGERVAYIG